MTPVFGAASTAFTDHSTLTPEERTTVADDQPKPHEDEESAQ